MQNWTPDDLKTAIEGEAPVFLKLWKKGCGPCKLSTPALERIEAADTYGVSFGQICVDDYPEMYDITETEILPAFFVFKQQAMAGSFVGFKGLAKLQEFIGGALAEAVE